MLILKRGQKQVQVDEEKIYTGKENFILDFDNENQARGQIFYLIRQLAELLDEEE